MGYKVGVSNLICVVGSVGVVDFEVLVVLVNLISGVVGSVLSKTNGSFCGFVVGEEEDKLVSTFVVLNGIEIIVYVDC